MKEYERSRHDIDTNDRFAMLYVQFDRNAIHFSSRKSILFAKKKKENPIIASNIHYLHQLRTMCFTCAI